MNNKQLQELLKQYPDDCQINIHVNGETTELELENAYIDYDAVNLIILLTMNICNLD